MSDAHHSGLISVVLCTYENDTRLRETLRAFDQISAPRTCDWELVAVDNNSTDRTKEVIRSFEERLPIRYVFEPVQGLSNARNTGLSAAEGAFILFTDDDVIPSEQWLRVYEQAYREVPEGCFFGGPVVSRFEGPGLEPELRALAPWSVRGLDLGTENRALEPGELFLGANWGAPAAHLSAVGAFDPNLGLNPEVETPRAGEESDLMHRLFDCGLEGRYLARARIEHVVPASKCSLSHIAQRIEANAHGSVTSQLRSSMAGGPAIGSGHVAELGKEVTKFLVYGLRWSIGRAIDGTWKEPYLRWRGARGSLRGYWNGF